MRSKYRNGYLLDTNVISETAKRVAAPRVLRFLEATPDENKFLSVLTLGELRVGAYKLHSRRPQEGAKLTKWIEKTESTFSTRVLPVDALIADIWAQFSAERDRPRFDTLIGATASAYGFILVTRNTKDFEGLPIEVLNPWLA